MLLITPAPSVKGSTPPVAVMVSGLGSYVLPSVTVLGRMVEIPEPVAKVISVPVPLRSALNVKYSPIYLPANCRVPSSAVVSV